MIVIFDGFSPKLVLHHESFQANHGFLDRLVLPLPREVVHFSIEVHFRLLHLLLSDESRSTDSLLIAAQAVTARSTSELGLGLRLLVH